MNEIFLGCDKSCKLELDFTSGTTSHKSVTSHLKTAMRLKYINGTSLESIPFRYIRSRYSSRHLLPSTLSPVYTIPTLEEDTCMFVVQFSRLQSY